MDPAYLWFVPVMMAFILAAAATRLSRAHMLAVSVPFSIGAMYIFGVGHDVWQVGPWMPDRRYFIYPIYFALGMWAAKRPFAHDRVGLLLTVSLGGAAWWAWLYQYASVPSEAAAELLLCVPLIVLLPRLKDVRFDIPLLSAVGRDSLFFYLWHPLAFAAWQVAGVSGAPLLILSVGSSLLVWVAVSRTTGLARILGACPPHLRQSRGASSLPEPATTGGAA